MNIAFVIPWFHENIGGGAEALCRDTAQQLQETGHDITILTTCIKEHGSDWNINHFPEGPASEAGIKVLRFKADEVDRDIFGPINEQFMSMNELDKYQLAEDDEDYFFKRMAPSTALMDYIRKNLDSYDCFIFLPYLFFPAIYGTKICGNKSILIPCLHDEGYAYSRPVKESLKHAGGIIFNSHAEQELAKRIIDSLPERQAVIGKCVPVNECVGNAEDFRKRFGISKPFLLYAGRRDSTKRVDVLVSYFLEYRKSADRDIQLVLIGPEEINVKGLDGIMDLGFVSLKEKHDAYAACSWFCNASLNESFSIVLLEAWANRKPVIVAGGCGPARDFCERSNGGLWFDDFSEFSAILDHLSANPDLCAQMGTSGRKYVENNFSKEVILKKYKQTLSSWCGK